MQTWTPRKLQDRSVATRLLLLQAAQQIFSRSGFEQAQMEEIAESAGFSKGGLYAHFKSKEDLFLALYEMRNAEYLKRLDQVVRAETSAAKKREAYRTFYIDLSKDRSWALLSLEFKSYALRYPEARLRLRDIDAAQVQLVDGSLLEVLGAASIPASAALGSMLPAVVIGSMLEPDVLGEEAVRTILGQIFDALIILAPRHEKRTLQPSEARKRSNLQAKKNVPVRGTR